MNYNDVPYKEIPSEEECVVNAVQIGKRLGEEPSTIRSWANTYEPYLYIKKTNGRLMYTEKSVEQFEFIQKLRNKNFPHSQIIEMIKNFGFDNNNLEADIQKLGTPMAFQSLVESLSIENEKQLKKFLYNFVETQQQQQQELMENLKHEMAVTVQETMEASLDELKKENQELKDKLDCITNNLSSIQEENDKIHELQQRLVEKKEEYESKNKGFFGKLFGR